MGQKRSLDSPSRHLAARLVLVALAMFAFGFALVPLYDVFCDLTGLGGRTADSAANVTESPDQTRSVRVEFVTSLGPAAPWEFRPSVSHMNVHPGQLYETTFFAKNLSRSELVGHATPSVAPGRAAKYLQKTECFCFTPQPFQAGEAKDMPVVFVLDPQLPKHIDTVTLSYTFYTRQQLAQR